MVKNTEDRRVRRTKRLLREALTTLMAERDVSQITVRDLAECADVTRGAFYAHYKDVRDLLSQLENELLEALNELSREDATDEDRSMVYLTALFSIMGEYSDLLSALSSRDGDPSFRLKMREVLKAQCMEYLMAQHISDTEHSRFYAAFVSSGMGALTHQWISDGKKKSPEDMARIGSRLLHDGVFTPQA